jgi:hypothetical protein
VDPGSRRLLPPDIDEGVEVGVVEPHGLAQLEVADPTLQDEAACSVTLR